MPAIETVPVPSYQPLDPYHHLVDNLPITGLIERVELVNNQVDLNNADLVGSIGTQGSLANRLNQSINADGTLKTTAIDNALHSIAEHLDGDGFVRMTLDERAKLSFVADDATSLSISFDTISGTIAFTNTNLAIGPSDSITWRYDGLQVVADTNFPASVRHVHYYGLVPVTSNHQNYTTTSIDTAYIEGSLRVYVNGVRLNTDHTVTSLKYTEGTATDGIVTGGDFSLSSAISPSASIVIDFDVLYI